MKNVITAIGCEELNNILKKQGDVNIKNSDIQYQEGIIEALEKYHDIDVVILNEDIIGNMRLDELIGSIIMLKNKIEIILITKKQDEFQENKNIVKIIYNNQDYVENVKNYVHNQYHIKYKSVNHANNKKLKDKENILYKINVNNKILKENVEEKKENNYKANIKNFEQIKCNKKEQNKIITVIGHYGVRKNNFYLDHFEIIKK